MGRGRIKQDKAVQTGPAGASSEAQGATGSEAGQGREGSARGVRGEAPASAELPSGNDKGGAEGGRGGGREGGKGRSGAGGRLRPKCGRGKVPSAIGWAGQGRGVSSSCLSRAPLRHYPGGYTK